MADDGIQTSEGSAGKWILLALAALYVAGSLYFIFDLRERIDKLSKEQTASSKQIAELSKRMQSAEADDETLAHQVGLTKKEMASRSAELKRQQTAAEARCRTAEAADQRGQRGSSRSQDRCRRSQNRCRIRQSRPRSYQGELQSTIGDLGVQSGLMANTRDDLEVLKHKGDRNYYEFTLIKGAKAQPVSTVACN